MPRLRDVRIRSARTSDRDAIVALLALCLGTGRVPRSVEFWSWKHERNPFGASSVLVAESRGQIVGLRAFLRWRWRSGIHEVSAVRAVDTATHPEWRGQGLFSKLTLNLAAHEADRGTAFVFNTPNRSSGPGYLKMGWRRTGRVPVWMRPLRLLILGRRARGATPRPFAEMASVGSFLDLPWSDELLGRLGCRDDDPRYRAPVSRDYLRWRYHDIPGFDYRAVWRGPGAGSVALILRTRLRGRFREIRVAAMLIPDEPPAVRAAADLLQAVAVAAAADTDVMTLAASAHTPQRSAAIRSSFIPTPFLGPSLFVRELVPDPELPAATAACSWRLEAGDLEIF